MKNGFSKQKTFDLKELIPVVVILILFAIAFWLYPSMPPRMPVHWNAEGQIDSYGSRFIALFLLPLVTAALLGIFAIIPYVAVHRENIRSFYFFFYAFKLVFVGFMAALYVISLLPNFGVQFNMNYLIIPLMAVLIYFAGVLMEKSKRNFFIGLRTQWTLSSDAVWERSNTIAGKGFKVIAALMVVSLIVQKYAVYIMVAMLLGFVAFLVPYSYYLYQKELKSAIGSKRSVPDSIKRKVKKIKR
jgi:uncharacterized membrane protein